MAFGYIAWLMTSMLFFGILKTVIPSGYTVTKSKKGALMNDYDVVAKISIVPRGPAGGGAFQRCVELGSFHRFVCWC